MVAVVFVLAFVAVFVVADIAIVLFCCCVVMLMVFIVAALLLGCRRRC